MPFGTWKTWPFATPGLPGLVLNDQDYRNRGYIWGRDGRVWYCFLDPERYAFDIWRKEFHASHLAWLIPNLLAAAVAFKFGGPWLAFKVFAAIPTGAAVFLDHYASSAKDQPAAVVTNGPQMEYPGKLGSMGMAGTVTVLSMAGAVAAGLNVMRTITITIGGKTIVLTGLVKAIAGAALGVGIGFNLACLLIFIAGLLSTPYFQLNKAGAVLDAGMNYGGWYNFGRNAQSISSYKVTPDAPSATPGIPPNLPTIWGSGGLIPIVYNRRSMGAPGLQTVVWSLIKLAPDGSWLPPPQPPSEETPNSGSGSEPPVDDSSTWAAGMLLVAGSENWGGGETATLIAHGVVHATACDAHFSPLLGSSGELVMETYAFIDPIGKYGFMCLPQ